MSRSLLALAAAVLFAGCASATTSASMATPAGAWGKLISCIRGHPLLSVSAAGASTSIGKGTNAIVVLPQVSGGTIAYLGDVARGADGVTSSDGIAVDRWAGPVTYGFASSANALQRRIITDCIDSSRIAHNACAQMVLGGQASCAFAVAVVAVYQRAAAGIRGPQGIVSTTIHVRDPRTHRLYRMICLRASGGVVCGRSRNDTRLAVAFTPHN